MAAAADRTMDFFQEECSNARLTAQDKVEELQDLIDQAQDEINALEHEC